MMLPSVDGISRNPVAPAQANDSQAQNSGSPVVAQPQGKAPQASSADRVAVSRAASRQANVPQPANEGEVMEAAKAASERVHELVQTLSQRFTSVKFRIHEDYEQIVVDVVGKESGEIIRQIPSEEILNMRAKMEELRGLLFSETS